MQHDTYLSESYIYINVFRILLVLKHQLGRENARSSLAIGPDGVAAPDGLDGTWLQGSIAILEGLRSAVPREKGLVEPMFRSVVVPLFCHCCQVTHSCKKEDIRLDPTKSNKH